MGTARDTSPKAGQPGPEGAAGRPPAVWPFLLLCAVAAAVIDLGHLHDAHTSDSLLPVLVSLQHWTPFFWQQDRVGMLVPLLAMPVRNPLANLLVQNALYVWALLAAFFLLARWMVRDGSYPLVAVLGASTFLLLASASYCFDFLSNTFYGVWLSLGFGGLLLLEARPGRQFSWWRWPAALLLLGLAHWCFVGAGILLGPVVLFRHLVLLPPKTGGVGPLRRWLGGETGHALLALGIALLVGLAMMGLATNQETYVGGLPIARWPTSWGNLLGNAGWEMGPWWPLTLLAVALLPLGIASLRRRTGRALRLSAALLAAGGVYILFVGTRQWVEQNSFADRYTKPAVFLWQAALAILAVVPVAGLITPEWRRRLCWITAPVLLATALTAYGWPSLAGVRADLDQSLGGMTADVREGRCTHIAGGYWNVWTAVFHANLVRYERGEEGMVWGVTYRARVMRQRWEPLDTATLRVAVAPGDEKAAREWLTGLDFPALREVERRPTLRVWRP